MSTINGTIFDDNLVGTNQNDSIFGDAGDDKLFGLNGNDFLDGWTGNDTLYGGYGNDTLFGYAGNDNLQGGIGNDVLAGESGDDLLNGYGHTEYEYDILNGGTGADLFILGDAAGAYYQGYGFATISDFIWNEGDKIQVFGNIEDYSLYKADGSTDIYYQGDLIGYVENTTNILLEDFVFVE
ncbi:MAG: calcium-binding protein [Pleurocapsa sp.]